MIYCKELDKNYNNKEELFLALKENKDFIISAKKAIIYESLGKGLIVSVNQTKVNKALETIKSFNVDDNYYYFVVNSSNILDSHDDMHVEGNWEKTVKEQQGKVFLVFDHTLKRSEIIAMKQDIEMFTATIPFSAIGKNYEGETYCLIYKIRKDKIINKEAKEWLEKGYDFEASVRMLYMDISLAMKSDRLEDKKERDEYDKYYPLIANKEDFEQEINYFWVVKQSKNVYESSLVMFASNQATGRIQENKTEADTITSETIEPSLDTQTNKRKLSII